MNETMTGTEAALVVAARGLFAQHGYDGTSVRAVTGAAGANLGAITYHFGSKRVLYDCVVESVVSPLADRIESVGTAGGSALDRAESVVRTYFDYLAENPDLAPLMMQELVLGGVPPERLAAPLRRIHGALTTLVVEGQASGLVKPGARLALGIFILSVPVHLAMLQRALRHYVGLDLTDPGTREQVVELAVAFVRDGLRASLETRTNGETEQ
jgi:AcrR family transcriptional regulator